jgi:hypothetical protein
MMFKKKYILAIDLGTSKTTALLCRQELGKSSIVDEFLSQQKLLNPTGLNVDCLLSCSGNPRYFVTEWFWARWIVVLSVPSR